MNNLMVIDEREILGKEFRIYGDFENPLFKVSDVANWIGHSNPSQMIKDVDLSETEVEKHRISTLSNSYSAWFLTEDGLYEVLMQSRKPIAKQFKTKVKEILKSIRKNGMYATDNTIEKMLNDPDFAIGLLTKLKEERAEKNRLALLAQEQKIKIEQDKPKVETYDTVFDEKYFDAKELADMLNVGIGRNKLLKFLRDKEILNDNNVPYVKYVNGGYCKQVPTNKGNMYGGVIMKTVFSNKMLDKLVKYFKSADRVISQ